MEMTKEYRGFDDWNDLFEKYKDLDMSSEKNQQALCNDFKEISELYFLAMLKKNYASDVADTLSNMWCSRYEFSDYTKEDYAEEALSRIEYSSDRMNINRWMHIRILLNKLID